MKLKFLWIIALMCLCGVGKAQNVSVTSAVGQNPTTLINNHLAGPGVLLTNGKFNNSTANITSAQIGTFSYTGTNFPFSSGLIMTTGNVTVAAGPNSSGSSSSTTGVVSYTDSQLSSYATSTLYNSASLDFNFVAYSDTFAFSYIFGSDEYPEFACSSFNDVFAFLLTGEDPVTGAQTTRNIAVIPNSVTASYPNGTPVAINTVNAGPGTSGSLSYCPNYQLYTQYYQNNTNGHVEYDGYTVEMTAQATISACSQYSMHLSIANVGDNAYDSGVFLKEGSFYSPSMEILKEYNIDPDGSSFGDTVVQNCRDLDIRFQLPRAVLTGNYHCNVSFLGDAVIGQDYTLSRDGISMSQVENSFYFTQGSDSVVMHLSMLPTATCNNGEVKTVMLVFHTVFCEDYYNAGHDDAGSVDTLYFYLKCNDTIRLLDQELASCYRCENIYAEQQSGADDLLYQWVPTTDITNPTALSSPATIEQNRTYQIIAQDRYGCLSDTATVEVTIHEQPTVDLHITPENGCAPLAVTLTNVNTPDNCQIEWHIWQDTIFDYVDDMQSTLNLTLDSAGYYNVYLWISTAPGCSDSLLVENAIRVSDYPHASFSFSPEEPNNGETVYFTNESTGENIVSYLWNFGDGGTSTDQDPEHAYHLSSSDSKMVYLQVTNEDGCSDDTSQVISIVDNFALYVPNAFTPNNDNMNDVFQPKVSDVAYYRLEIYDRNGNMVFKTEDTETPWDGTVRGKPALIGTYVWKIYYIRYSDLTTTMMRRGTVTLVR